MYSKNSGTSDSQRLLLNLTYKINLNRTDKHVALSNLSIYYTWKNVNMSYNNNKFKISAPTRDFDGRKMTIVQIHTCDPLYFLLKGVHFDVPSYFSK